MSTWARSLGAAALVAALATGCASGDSATTGSRGGEPPAAPSAGGSTTREPSAAVSVRVVVTGGIAGDHEVYEVSRGDAAAAATARVLDLAAAAAVRDFATQRRRPSVQCCDIQVYEVAIRYADGTSARIATDSTAAPPQLQRLVALMSTTR